MTKGRTFWHVLFGYLLRDRAPPGVTVISEFELGAQPQRVDFLLLQRSGQQPLEPGRVLRGLWPLLPPDAVVEFKSAARPLRPGDLVSLLGYGAQYHASVIDRISRGRDLALVLLTASRTPTLDAELLTLGWSLESLGAGYWRIHGCEYPGIVAFLDDVSQSERDDLLGFFGHRNIETEESSFWLERHGHENPEATMADVEGYKEVMSKFLAGLPYEERMRGIPDEERMRGIPDEERMRGIEAAKRLRGIEPGKRLQGLSAEDAILELPTSVLCGFTPEYLATLSAELRERIARKLAETTHH